MQIRWKDIDGYKGLYRISNKGEIYALDRIKGNGRFSPGHMLKPIINGHGYSCVSLYDHYGKPDQLVIHRLVALHFIRNPKNSPFINHRNGIKTDNRAENLEWCTQFENCKHAYETGLTPKGEKNYNAKLKEADVLRIKELIAEGISQRKIAPMFNVSPSLIRSINLENHWKHLCVVDIVEGEIWQDIAGYENLYRISNKGRVASYDKTKINGQFIQGRMKKFSVWSYYFRVSLVNSSGIQKWFMVHRLVAEAFIPNPDNKPIVNHKNGNKKDNTLENLEWATISENNQHAYDTGLNVSYKGENVYNAKLTTENVLQIKQMFKDGGYLQREIAEMFNVKVSTIQNIKNGSHWKHISLS